MPRQKKEAPPVQETPVQEEKRKPKCPFLATIGEKEITCTNSNCVNLGRKEFGSKKDCMSKADSHCFDRFLDCEDYRKYYVEQKAAEEGCIHCCNNSWYTGLPAGYDGQKYCFCQIEQQPKLHKDTCEWCNRHPDWSQEAAPLTLHDYENEFIEEAHCRVCGCTEFTACDDNGMPCAWVEPDLCSACVTFLCDDNSECPVEVPSYIGCMGCESSNWEVKVKDTPVQEETPIQVYPGGGVTIGELSIGELAHQSQVEFIQDPANNMTFGCISTPYRTYGEPICPKEPNKKKCEKCWAWKEVAAPVQEVTMEAALDLILNGPGPTAEEKATEKERFKDDLGRLFDGKDTSAGPGYTMAAINLCYPAPNNPRKRFDQESLDKLTESVRQVGILEPILCVKDEDPCLVPYGLRIVAGERRYRAALAAGLAEVPVIVRDLTPDQEFEVMLTENIQRQDLDPIEEATAFKAACDRGWKQEELAAKLGISQAQVANRLRLLKLPDEVQELISREILSPGHGLALVKVAAAPGMVKDMAKEFTERHTSVKDAMGRINAEVNSTGRCYGKQYGRPLYTEDRHNDAPKFDFQTVCLGPYESRKGPCKYIVNAERPCYEAKQIDSKEERPYCIHPECWDKRQKEAVDTQREAEMARLRAKAEAAGKDPDKIKLPDVRKMDYNSREVFRSYSRLQLENCPGCGKVIDAMDGEEIVKVCTDKPCWDKKIRAQENATVRESKQSNIDFEKTKDEEIRQVMEGRCERIHLIYMALQAFHNPACSSKWTPSKVRDKAIEVFALPCNDSIYDEQNRQQLADQLYLMSDKRLLQFIFYCNLRGLDNNGYTRPFYDLTLGAAAGEDTQSV